MYCLLGSFMHHRRIGLLVFTLGAENTAGSLHWSEAQHKLYSIVNTLKLIDWSSQEEKKIEVFEKVVLFCLKEKVYIS